MSRHSTCNLPRAIFWANLILTKRKYINHLLKKANGKKMSFIRTATTLHTDCQTPINSVFNIVLASKLMYAKWFLKTFPYQFVDDSSLLTSDIAFLKEPSSLISTCVDIFSSCNGTKSKTQRLNRYSEKQIQSTGRSQIPHSHSSNGRIHMVAFPDTIVSLKQWCCVSVSSQMSKELVSNEKS